jgi:hypothetical protein
MSEDKKYNGWTNYATWRIHLEIFSDSDHFAESYENVKDVHDLSKLLEEYVQEILGQEICGDQNSLVLSYALSFVSEVNYYEIAEHIWEQIQENKEEETPETESEVQ